MGAEILAKHIDVRCAEPGCVEVGLFNAAGKIVARICLDREATTEFMWRIDLQAELALSMMFKRTGKSNVK